MSVGAAAALKWMVEGCLFETPNCMNACMNLKAHLAKVFQLDNLYCSKLKPAAVRDRTQHSTLGNGNGNKSFANKSAQVSGRKGGAYLNFIIIHSSVEPAGFTKSQHNEITQESILSSFKLCTCVRITGYSDQSILYEESHMIS